MAWQAQRGLRFIALAAHAWLLLAAFDLARHAGFSHICSWLRRLRPASRRSWAGADDIVWAVDEACVWYVKRAACLQRSAVATWLLRRHGLRAETVIGCRPLPFESHAWVEVDGRVVNDRPQYQNAFTVLDRL
ncbi:MAG: lasso peptide biosynthesis B2 protein [Acidobacteria bacterium]|nr:lasso peptide biosynthesis B2 protein [Acidobacteriota bacterium]